MAFEHPPGFGFEFGGPVFEVGAGTALLLAGVARHFGAVDVAGLRQENAGWCRCAWSGACGQFPHGLNDSMLMQADG